MLIRFKSAYLNFTAGQQVDVPDEHAKPLIEKGLADKVEDNALASLIERQLGASLQNVMKGLDDTINETLKKFQQAQALSRKNAVPLIFGEGKTGDPHRNFEIGRAHV